MADCSRPPHRDQRGLTKNMSSVFGLGSNKGGAYDDVFSARPRMRAPAFTPGPKDYVEIFNCSKPSSIPVLELDERREGFADFAVDYGNVFGGFDVGRIGSSFEEVFCVGRDGVRRENTSQAHSKGSNRSTVAEESQKPAHESLSVKKPDEKITLGGKGGIYATNGEAKITEVPPSARAADRNISLKNSRVSASSASANHIKQHNKGKPVEKHSRSVSFGGLSKNDANFVDLRYGNGHGSYKSVSSDPQMGTKIIRAKVHISEATGGRASSEILMGNSNAQNSNANDNAKDEECNFSQQDVKFRSVDSATKPLVNCSKVDESAVGSQENSKSTPAAHTQLSGGELNTNTAFEGPKIIASAGSESTHMGPNERPSIGVNSRNEVGLKEPISISMAAETEMVNLKSQNSKAVPPSGVKDSDSSSSSDDEMDKNSEAAISAAAVKKAIRDAQTWIKIAKESNGVKGFMNHATKKSGHVKVEKEARNSKVEVNLKSSESRSSVSSASKCGFASGSISSEIKTGADDILCERTELCDSDRAQQTKELNIQISPRKNLEVGATVEHATPSFNAFNASEERLAIRSSNVSEKLVQRKEDIIMQNTEVESEQVLALEEKCSEVPNIESRVTKVNSVGKEIFHESNTVSEITKAEKESQETTYSNDRGSLIPTFQDDFGRFEVGRAANNVEVKEDVVPETQDHSNQNEGVTFECKDPFIPCLDNAEKDSTFSEEEDNVKQSELDPHDQVSVSDDADSEDYMSAEENWASTDTEDEINVMDPNLSAQNQPDEINEMETSTLAPEVALVMENILPPCFNGLNEDSVVEEEANGSEDMPFQNNANYSSDGRTTPTGNFLNEEPVVEEINVSEDMLSQEMVSDDVANVTSAERTEMVINHLNEDLAVGETDDMPLHGIAGHEAGLASEEKTEPFCNYSNEVEGTCVREKAHVMHIVTHESKVTSEDGLTLTPCFSSSNENPRIKTEVIVDLTEQDMEIEDDPAPCFDESDQDYLIEEIAPGITEESSVSVCSSDYKYEKGEFCAHQQSTLNLEELESVSRLEAESASIFGNEFSPSEDSEVEVINAEADVIIDVCGAEPVEESRSSPSKSELERQELGAENHFNFLPETADTEELQNVAKVEPEVSKEGHDRFKNEQVNMDTAGQEEAVELQSTPLHTEIAKHELEAVVQFCESLPDFGMDEATAEMERQSENSVRPTERHERKRWEMPKETFELPELEIETSPIQDIVEQDGFQVEKHERKKWEIPQETFELPVLGDQVAEESDENEEHAEQSAERVEKSAEKPERKKWNIQKEAFEVPVLLAEGFPKTPEHEGFVIETASEEVVQPAAVETDCSAIGDIAAPCNMEKEESQNQLKEMVHGQETKVEEEKAVGQEECATRTEDVNVKDEIKKTLGKLWKKLYTGKQNEDSESMESAAKEEASFMDGIGRGVDLNLKGPVELVESPRQHDDVEALNFSGRRSRYAEISEDASWPFEVNEGSTCNNIEFVSTTEVTVEVQDNSLSEFDCEHHEDEKASKDEEIRNQNCSENDVESLSEEIPSSYGSEDSSKMAPFHEAGELKSEGTPVMTSDVNECSGIDSETVGGLEHPTPVDSSVDSDYAENTLNAHDGVADENKSEDEGVDDSSDKSYADSEQQGRSASGVESRSDSDNKVCDDTSSHEFEHKEDKNGTGPDLFEQGIKWKWIFGDDLRDESNGKVETPEEDLPGEGEAKTEEMADETNTSLVTGKEEVNSENPPRMEERAAEGMQKEVISDQEAFKNMMRAKEIERMVVERAIREARERAFAEARERAAAGRSNAEARERAASERVAMERANSDARERAARERANDQERSQKMSSEAKLAAEKNALEAKRKSEIERAAVERATAEARQRALEKAMSRKDQASQSSSSRPNSSSNDHYGSSSKDRLSDDKPSESALRFKARNERHQRIAERAAKALAEKNMRDLLVQREQAERNRLAEVLDADVKRWARGKTGNLRALLSTLQYILGADSGWQPIHLTDVVTADAVKKAYRKATLFVHPDKLQQRGATIRQKYICEKVFDLLKEAWNKFDRDER